MILTDESLADWLNEIEEEFGSAVRRSLERKNPEDLKGTPIACLSGVLREVESGERGELGQAALMRCNSSCG